MVFEHFKIQNTIHLYVVKKTPKCVDSEMVHIPREYYKLNTFVTIELNYLLNRITYLRLAYNRTLKQLSKGAAVFSVAERVFKQQSNTVSCCAM